MRETTQNRQHIHQPPPHDIPAEQATLGAILIEPGAVERAFAIVQKEDFYPETHRAIFRAMEACRERGEPVDIITVANELRHNGQLDDVGGGEYITELTQRPPTAAHVSRYASIVAEKGAARRLIEAAAEIQRRGYDDPADMWAFKCEADELLREATERIHPPELGYTTGEQAAAHLKETSWRWRGWLPEGYITVVAGDPGVGKTAIMMYVALADTGSGQWPDGTSPQLEKPTNVLWIDAEGCQALLLERMDKWGLPKDRVILPGADGLDQVQLDEPGAIETIGELAAKTQAGLVVVDSLRAAHQGDENSSEMSRILTRAAVVARDKGIAIVFIHHLRKKSVFEGSDVTLDRLRGSSAIAAAARVVWVIDKPDSSNDAGRLQVIKSNLGGFPPPIGYVISERGVQFLPEAPGPYREPTLEEKAQELLRAQLQCRPQPLQKLLDKATDEGISRATLYRARRSMHLATLSLPDSTGKEVTHWALPPTYDETPETGETESQESHESQFSWVGPREKQTGESDATRHQQPAPKSQAQS